MSGMTVRDLFGDAAALGIDLSCYNFSEKDLEDLHEKFKDDKNPYFTIFSKLNRNFIARQFAVKKYSWAIPSDHALEKIAEFSNRIVEIGAGKGYWAHMLSKYDCDVVCYDNCIAGNQFTDNDAAWHLIFSGSEKEVANHSDRALMLCWTPYTSNVAINSLTNYSGDKLIHIGESQGGCTDSDEFFDALDNWKLVEEINIPQWNGIHDMLSLYSRC